MRNYVDLAETSLATFTLRKSDVPDYQFNFSAAMTFPDPPAPLRDAQVEEKSQTIDIHVRYMGVGDVYLDLVEIGDGER